MGNVLGEDKRQSYFSARYASVKRFVTRLRGTVPAEARVVITTAPGVAAQVDYGEGPMVRYPAGASAAARGSFVMPLGHSRKSVRILT